MWRHGHLPEGLGGHRKSRVLILVQMPFRWPSPPASVAREEAGCLFGKQVHFPVDEEVICTVLGKQGIWVPRLGSGTHCVTLARKILPDWGLIVAISGSAPLQFGVLLGSCFGHKRAAEGFGVLRNVGQMGLKNLYWGHWSLLRPRLGGARLEGRLVSHHSNCTGPRVHPEHLETGITGNGISQRLPLSSGMAVAGQGPTSLSTVVLRCRYHHRNPARHLSPQLPGAEEGAEAPSDPDRRNHNGRWRGRWDAGLGWDPTPGSCPPPGRGPPWALHMDAFLPLSNGTKPK